MDTLRIDILNPKAKKLLKDLADLDLIAIRKDPAKDFKDVLNNIRKKNEGLDLPSLDEITAEVEAVRAERHGK